MSSGVLVTFVIQREETHSCLPQYTDLSFYVNLSWRNAVTDEAGSHDSLQFIEPKKRSHAQMSRHDDSLLVSPGSCDPWSLV